MAVDASMLLREMARSKERARSPSDVRSLSMLNIDGHSTRLVRKRAAQHRRSVSGPPTVPLTLRRITASTGAAIRGRLPKRYTDHTKPKPLFRGLVHGLLSLGLFFAIIGLGAHQPILSIALFCKLCTYATVRAPKSCSEAEFSKAIDRLLTFRVLESRSDQSATFHLVPFPTVTHETRAFIADIALVPMTAIGTIVPFLSRSDIYREVSLAAVTFVANVCLVLWQTRGQVGLKTQPGRSDTPRSFVVCLYSIWTFLHLGVRTSFSGAWFGMLIFSLLAGFLADCVAKAHEHEPTARWACWHVPGIYSFHEDFHLSLLCGDACWLMLALQSLR